MSSIVALYASIYNECAPRQPTTEQEVRRGLERNPERRLFARGDDACALVTRSGLPGHASVYLYVRPTARGRGLGSSLYLEAAAYAASIEGASAIFGKVEGGDERSRGFAQRRGFHEVGREIELVRRLHPGELEPVPPAGIELVQVTDELVPGAHSLAIECTPDLPFEPPLQAQPLDRWREQELDDGPVAFAALDASRVVGFAGLLSIDARPRVLEHGLTAVRRSHRRRGIARALKQAAIAWASRRGYEALTTWTQQGNAAMHAVNVAVGFEPQPPVILLAGPLP